MYDVCMYVQDIYKCVLPFKYAEWFTCMYKPEENEWERDIYEYKCKGFTVYCNWESEEVIEWRERDILNIHITNIKDNCIDASLNYVW